MSETKSMKIRSYFLFFGSVLFLICIPYSFYFLGLSPTPYLIADGIFYNFEFTRMFIYQMNITSLLNFGIICSFCLYFIIQQQMPSDQNRTESQRTAVLFFLIVMISLVLLDYEYFILNSPEAHEYLSMFGLLLSYFVIVLYLFKINNYSVIVPDVANKVIRKIIANSEIILGLLLLILPFCIGIPMQMIHAGVPISSLTFYSATYSFEMTTIENLLERYFYIRIFLGYQPIFFQFLFYWLPQILFLILFFRYKSGYVQQKWFGFGILISFIPWIALFFFSLYGSSLLIIPLPLLQIASYVVFTKAPKSKRTILLLKQSTSEDDYSPIIKVPIVRIIFSRFWKWRSR